MSGLSSLLVSAALLLLLATGTAPALAQDAETPDERRARVVETYDKDGDGKLSGEERKALRETRAAKAKQRRAERIKRFDLDGDGELSKDERAAMRAKLAEGRGEHRKSATRRFDADGDGTLSDAERAAAREELRQRRAKRGAPNAN